MTNTATCYYRGDREFLQRTHLIGQGFSKVGKTGKEKNLKADIMVFLPNNLNS
jgi:hypothetical protein